MGDGARQPQPAGAPAGFQHMSVLLDEVAALLVGCRRVLDGTAGAGGHASRLAQGGARVIAIDRDPEAVRAARRELGEAATVRQLDFTAAAADPDIAAFTPDGVLLDLGLSSPQIDDAARGFTFRPGAPLDMRMTAGHGPNAADWLNGAPPEDLMAALADYGDEPRARALAREIARRRAVHPFAVSDDLVNAIRAVLGPRSGPAAFARLFQAVRIAVNGELERLAQALPDLLGLLVPGGIIAVISYHSGEDRVVKHAFREWARACVCPPAQPVCTCRGRALGTVVTKRAITPAAREVAANSRARSARLRAFRKSA
ncbi:MAG: 16S rRNA (cytosine(1402)-N(4))-methyltransferase RsmH [Gemmatimonadetes bacterium]|nr:16S rRNA (cytosine(1402)-N(4))-methyltransferase RsmH [Gemmatimonadota bacterium]